MPRAGISPSAKIASSNYFAFGRLSWFLLLKKHHSELLVPTYDTQVSYSLGTVKKRTPMCLAFYVVPRAGLEPARRNQLRILSPLCLPFHHPGKCLRCHPRGNTWRRRRESNPRMAVLQTAALGHFATASFTLLKVFLF